MSQPPDLFTELSPGSFDNIIIPVQRVQVSTGSAAARHKFPHRPGQRIEYTGREPITGSITAAYFPGIEEASFAGVELWPDELEDLRRRVQEQRSGELIVPTIGRIPRAKVDIVETYSFEAREGAFVELRFEEDSVDDFAPLMLASARGKLGQTAAVADAALAGAGISVGDLGSDADGNLFTSLANFAANIQGNLDRIQDDLAKPVRQLANLVARVGSLLETVTALGSPEDWPVRNALAELRDVAQQSVDDAMRQARTLRTYTVAAPTTLAHVASEVGNTVGELLSLNAVADGNRLDRGDELLVFVAT